MQRYFFTLNECDDRTIDEEGIRLPALADARARAVTQARAIMCAEIETGRLCLSCGIEIRDQAGDLLLYVPFKECVEVSGLEALARAV